MRRPGAGTASSPRSSRSLVARAPARAAEGELGSRRPASVAFPDRAYVLTLPPETVRLDRATSTCARTASSSRDVRRRRRRTRPRQRVRRRARRSTRATACRGRRSRSAMEAARAFAAQRKPEPAARRSWPSTATPSVAAPVHRRPSGDRARRSREPPELALRDADLRRRSTRALGCSSEADIAAGSVVVLSDGADTGSHAGSKARVASARGGAASASSPSVFARGASTRPRCERSRDATRRHVLRGAASPDELAAIFDALGAQLASEYLVRYRSLRRPRRRGPRRRAGRRASTASRRARYTTPRCRRAGRSAPYHPSFAERFWRSPSAWSPSRCSRALLSCASCLRHLRAAPADAPARMAEFVSRPLPASEDAGARAGRRASCSRGGRALARARALVVALQGGPRAGGDHDVRADPHRRAGRQSRPPSRMWLLFVAAGHAARPSGRPRRAAHRARAVIKRKVERQRQSSPTSCRTTCRCSRRRSGPGTASSARCRSSVEDAAEPSRREFRRVIADEQLGVPLEDALDVVVERMDEQRPRAGRAGRRAPARDGRQHGRGARRVTETIRERFELRRLVRR